MKRQKKSNWTKAISILAENWKGSVSHNRNSTGKSERFLKKYRVTNSREVAQLT